jgi:hypothetical protein
MRTFLWLVGAPFGVAALVTAVAGPRLDVARACTCSSDGTWVVEDVTVEGAPADFPTSGHLYPDRLHLWGEGFELDLVYAP